MHRRDVLRRSINIEKAFEQWAETCVPSYCHPNPAAAYVSWMRIFAASEIARECMPAKLGRVLDFGASVGELSHLLGDADRYEFIEQDDTASSFLMKQNPDAVRQTLQDAPRDAYDAVFAIDSLEHNENFAELLGELAQLIVPGGVLVLSGPTENALYKLGRRIAGFEGDYHFTTIYDIEKAASEHLEPVRTRVLPIGIPLFRITAWRRPAVSAAQAA
jgi:2-polyprenyl-3-methyl-5-hydroxy-6-metoxy-1,4-benzoquinol methylase